MKEKVPFRGVAFEYGDSYLIVPPITIDDAEELSGDIDAAKNPNGEPMAQFQSQLRVITAAIRRNYPDMTDKEIKRFLDMDNMPFVYVAAVGLNKRAPKVKSLGEITPATLSGQTLIGTPFAGESQPPQATDSTT